MTEMGLLAALSPKASTRDDQDLGMMEQAIEAGTGQRHCLLAGRPGSRPELPALPPLHHSAMKLPRASALPT